jgi:hypothetical protein
MLAGMPGFEKTIMVNNNTLALNSPINIFPEQELNIKDFIQGGPRSQIYELGKKIVKGNMSFPLTLDKNGDLDVANKEILECAQYPMRDLTIQTNYVLSKRYITADAFDYHSMINNTGFNVYNRMAFTNCAINKLNISVSESKQLNVNAEIIGMVSDTPVSNPSLPSINMMRRNISYAECDVFLTEPAYTWDTAKAFEINIENNIEPIYTFIENDDTSTWTDLPVEMAMGHSHISGEIIYSVDRSSADYEKASLPTGGWMGKDLIFDLSGIIIITIPHCIAELTQQPIELGLIERKTKFVALFNSTKLSENEGHFIVFK